ncbi:MAG: hypothetical protein SVK08_00695 [Halobacteriota archaeon]|nr:hypothetical protein [Halobacteriota archaeon]
MSREVRMVPANWEHPKTEDGRYQPMHNESYKQALMKWVKGWFKWQKGFYEDINHDWLPKKTDWNEITYTEWEGPPPNEEYYMPEIKAEDRTHYQMYETCSEGTPISPVMETAEELAQWLVDNNASAFAGMTATYEQWLNTIRRGFAISAIWDEKNGLRDQEFPYNKPTAPDSSGG